MPACHYGEITRNDWGRVRTRDIRALTKQEVAEKIGFREARKRNLSNFFSKFTTKKAVLWISKEKNGSSPSQAST